MIKEEKKLYEEKINIYEKELNELNKIIKNLENFIEEKIKEINKEKDKIKEMKDKLNKYSYNNIKEVEEFINKFKINEIDDLKLNISLLLKQDEKIISIIFISNDQNIHYSIICKNNDKFSKIESLLYDKYPEYKKTNNNFIVNGNKIDKSKNLKDNNIQNSDIIILI